jgi:hypothetical protein
MIWNDCELCDVESVSRQRNDREYDAIRWTCSD